MSCNSPFFPCLNRVRCENNTISRSDDIGHIVPRSFCVHKALLVPQVVDCFLVTEDNYVPGTKLQ